MSDVVTDHRAWATAVQSRLPIGFPVFDDAAGGLAQGELMLFLARPQVGKTAFAINVLRRTIGTPTLMFSLEMDAMFVSQRLAAVTYEVATQEMEYETKTTGSSRYMDSLVRDYPKLIIEDEPNMSVRRMGSAFDEAQEMLGEKPRLVIVDYLGLLKAPALEASAKVDIIANSLKALAREKQTSILCLHQVSRGDKNAGDQPLSLISGAFGGEAAADYILGAYKPALKHGITQDEYHAVKDEWYLQYLKTRSGGAIHPGGVKHHSNGQTMTLSLWRN